MAMIKICTGLFLFWLLTPTLVFAEFVYFEFSQKTKISKEQVCITAAHKILEKTDSVEPIFCQVWLGVDTLLQTPGPLSKKLMEKIHRNFSTALLSLDKPKEICVDFSRLLTGSEKIREVSEVRAVCVKEHEQEKFLAKKMISNRRP
jgi:hypothetical protein